MSEAQRGGEVAFVTGAASGIGRTLAVRLARRGIRLGLFDIDKDRLEALTRTISEFGGDAIAVAGDVGSDLEIGAAVSATAGRYGPVRMAAACAGVEATGSVVRMDPALWRRALSVNLDGVAWTARHCIPQMVDNGGGSIVAIASDAGMTGFRNAAPYCSSKHAVIGLIRSLAADFGRRGVRSNVVCPAFVETAMTERIFHGAEERRAHWKDVIPMQRFASPEEVAAVIEHLLSDEASFTNGHVYMVDGGETAWVPG